jgi:magnesium transporter
MKHNLKISKSKKKYSDRLADSYIHHVPETHPSTIIDIYNYSKEALNHVQMNPDEDFKPLPTDQITWINVIGVSDLITLEKISAHFHLHPLALEDILNTRQRPKIEYGTDYVYFIVKMLRYMEETDEIDVEQISLVLGRHYVISFQERVGDVFDSIREHLQNSGSHMRQGDADFMIYALLDAIIDNYFVVLEKTAEKIEHLEEELMSSPTPATLQSIHILRRELIFMHKAVWPLREVINDVNYNDSPLWKKSTMLYMHDLLGHSLQIMDNIETYREVTASLVDIYLSSVSNKLNAIMKFLTIFSTIFIPLTFIVGIYGMNFKNMPEFGLEHGYQIIWGIMIIIAGGMLYYFKKKDWI